MKPSDFVPTLAEKPESKPIYDTVRQVKQFERIAGCYQGANGCNCYSDQSTILEEVTETMCKKYIKNGLPFDPFREPETNVSVNNSN